MGKVRWASSVALAVRSKRSTASRHGHALVSQRMGFTVSGKFSTMFIAAAEKCGASSSTGSLASATRR